MEFFQSNINFVTSVQVFLSKYNGDYASQKEKKMSSKENLNQNNNLCPFRRNESVKYIIRYYTFICGAN